MPRAETASPALVEARRLVLSGRSIMPVKCDGTKEPAFSMLPLDPLTKKRVWSPYQSRLATDEEVTQWYGNGRLVGIALIGGRVSGNLEQLDFDASDTVIPYKRLVDARAPGLLDRMVRMATPRPGARLVYLCEEPVEGNLVLAQRQIGVLADGSPELKATIETRGEGGYAVVPGSPLTVHASRRPYRLLHGDLADPPVITAEERQVLLDCARSLNEYIAPPQVTRQPRRSTATEATGDRPGDAFNERGDVGSILTKHGWKFLFAHGETEYWQRAGKAGHGHSATLHHVAPNVLVSFSPNASPLVGDSRGKGYDAFAVFTLLEYRGDWKAAAASLRGQGYGTSTAARRGTANGRERPSAAPPPPEEPHDDADDRGQPGAPNLTDMGNAARFATQHQHTARFSAAHGWLVYDGRRWKPDDLDAVELGKHVVRAMHLAVADEGDKGSKKALSAWAFKSEENRRIQAMLSLSRSEPGIKVEGENLDRHAWLFNAANGTIDLATGQIKKHDAADLLTQIAPVEYDPLAKCPFFLAALLQMMKERQDLVTYLQGWLGHCLSGSTQAQELLFLHGMGANGKNTLMEVVQSVMGEYAVAAPPDLLVERQHEPHSQEIVSLAGKRLIVADETQQGRRFNEAQLKRLTSSGRYRGHLMRQNDIEFTPVFKIVLMANHKPVIKGTDDAIWRRPKLVPFDVKFHDPEAGLSPVKDLALPARLQEELPGILAWLVRGCVAWVQGGYRFHPPAVVLAASAAYRQEMDTLADFLAECCLQGSGLTVQSSVLHERYVGWCAKNHETALKQKAFTLSLLERGYQKELGGERGKAVVWKDLGLIDPEQVDPPAEPARWH